MANGAEVEAHLQILRTLCEQAESLRKVAEDLCERLTRQIEETRTRLVRTTTPTIERRRKTGNKTR
jgi:hypothetical protein